jgi:predicted protein tyrosine phosphatase
VRVLFVCTANICRSRMAEDVFRVLTWRTRVQDGVAGHEVRSAGIRPDPSGRPITRGDVEWADVICVMETVHETHIRSQWPMAGEKIRVLGIPDAYLPGDEALRDRLATYILALLAETGPPPA